MKINQYIRVDGTHLLCVDTNFPIRGARLREDSLNKPLACIYTEDYNEHKRDYICIRSCGCIYSQECIVESP